MTSVPSTLRSKGGAGGDIRPLSLKGIAFYVIGSPKMVASFKLKVHHVLRKC